MNKQVSIKEAEKDDVDEEPMTISEDDRDIDVFGSDFISVGMAPKTQDWLPFNSDANFILFNDEGALGRVPCVEPLFDVTCSFFLCF